MVTVTQFTQKNEKKRKAKSQTRQHKSCSGRMSSVIDWHSIRPMITFSKVIILCNMRTFVLPTCCSCILLNAVKVITGMIQWSFTFYVDLRHWFTFLFCLSPFLCWNSHTCFLKQCYHFYLFLSSWHLSPSAFALLSLKLSLPPPLSLPLAAWSSLGLAIIFQSSLADHSLGANTLSEAISLQDYMHNRISGSLSR